MHVYAHMKTQSSATLLINFSPLTKFRAALEWRNVVPILVLLGLYLTLGPLTAIAKAHREPDWQRSLILPPPNEPPPPPPPGEDLLIDYDESAELAGTKLCDSSAQADYGNVLELPRSIYLQRHRVLAVNREYKADGQLNHKRLRREYSEEDVDENWPPEDESPMDNEPDPTLHPADHTPLKPLTGGFIPLNPRGITVRPGERSPFPPTSPLLTPPLGSSARPYAWRP
jgi:hypothetical protein